MKKIYKVSVTDCLIKASSKEQAVSGFCNYLTNDLGIECFVVEETKIKPDDDEPNYDYVA